MSRNNLNGYNTVSELVALAKWWWSLWWCPLLSLWPAEVEMTVLRRQTNLLISQLTRLFSNATRPFRRLDNIWRLNCSQIYWGLSGFSIISENSIVLKCYQASQATETCFPPARAPQSSRISPTCIVLVGRGGGNIGVRDAQQNQICSFF